MTAYQQYMANISSFEAPGLSFIDSPISKVGKTIPREVILNLKGLEEDLQQIKIFISIEKDKNGNFILYYKSKYHQDASTIADYLAAVMVKQYPCPILHVFDAYHQEMAKDVLWEDGIPKSKEEDELDKDLAEQLEWIQLPEDLDSSSNKHAINEIKEMSVRTFATDAYGITTKKVCSGNAKDNLQQQSTQELKSSLVPN